MKEIEGKSTLVQVSARFVLGRVRVIGSRLYNQIKTLHLAITVRVVL